MKELKNDESGFTLVEVIIVMAVAAILAGTAYSGISMLSAGNAKKAATKFDSYLSTLQTDNLTKKDKEYMYLYVDADGKSQILYSESDMSSRSDVVSAAGATDARVHEVAQDGISVMLNATDKTNSGSSQIDKTDGVLKISFDKSTGAFSCSSKGSDGRFYDEISFGGSSVVHAKLVKATGKHFVK